ncbi:MAG: hypothetical protein R2856_11060 [Caldilineaceae bacterium]
MDGSLWIGSEGGVTRYDGRTWETLSVDNILPNASIFSIAYTLDGTYLFGGKDGLTYYHQESTPPGSALSRFRAPSSNWRQARSNSTRASRWASAT